jgi:solute carrier family 25 protein 38
MMPITVVKVRFESNIYNYKNVWDATTCIFKTEGIRGFFSGFGATAMRDAPFAGIYVFFYENCKILSSTSISSTIASNMISGISGGLLATTVTQPFDMLKTRLQLKPKEYKNMVYGFKKIFLDEGWRGLFAGMLPRMFRKSLSSAISWTLYEEYIKRNK